MSLQGKAVGEFATVDVCDETTEMDKDMSADLAREVARADKKRKKSTLLDCDGDAAGEGDSEIVMSADEADGDAGVSLSRDLQSIHGLLTLWSYF